MSDKPKCRSCRDAGLIQHPALHRFEMVDCPYCPCLPECPVCGGAGEVEREVNRVVIRYGQEFAEDVPMMFPCEECGGDGVILPDIPTPF